jgi:hypothetical protein
MKSFENPKWGTCKTNPIMGGQWVDNLLFPFIPTKNLGWLFITYEKPTSSCKSCIEETGANTMN